MGKGDCCINDIIGLPTMERIEKLWRAKEINPLNEWIRLRGTPYALQYFPYDFDNPRTFLTESELKDSNDQTRKWYSDYLDLMDHTCFLKLWQQKSITHYLYS